MTHAALKDLLKEYDRIRDHVGGCSDGGCVVKRPVGMHTNGGCKCSTDRLKAQRMMYAGQKLRDELSAALSAMEGEAAVEILGWNDNASPRLRFLTKVGRLTAGTILYTAPPPQQAGGGNSSEVADMDGFFQQVNAELRIANRGLSTPPQPEAGGGVAVGILCEVMALLRYDGDLRGRDLSNRIEQAVNLLRSTTPASGGEHG